MLLIHLKNRKVKAFCELVKRQMGKGISYWVASVHDLQWGSRRRPFLHQSAMEFGFFV